tara:strand:- start:381 stop:491 length:111 start_codon:yes stop_codon:yes gene_type:complete
MDPKIEQQYKKKSKEIMTGGGIILPVLSAFLYYYLF